MKGLTPIQEVVLPYLRKFPDVPSRTLGRMIMTDHPGLFTGLERARKTVAFYRGRNHKGTGRVHPSKLVASTCPSAPGDPYALPVSEEQDFTPYKLEYHGDKRVAILSDIHVPYHSISALKAVFADLSKWEPQVVILNGDTLDFYRISRFSKDPRRPGIKVEIERANELLDALDELFPKAFKIWKDGNHDERLDHYLMAAAPEIYGVARGLLSVEKLMLLKERGWDYVTDKRPMKLGKLYVIHGHEYPTPVLGPVNAARGLFLRTKESCAVSHHHQTSEHTEPTISEGIIATWSIACLCELHPEYARFNKWNQGFAKVDLARNGDYRFDNKKIFKGRVL